MVIEVQTMAIALLATGWAASVLGLLWMERSTRRQLEAIPLKAPPRDCTNHVFTGYQEFPSAIRWRQ